ncbi:hypothetical protein C8R46DRAFT_284705 [Mycena filopes]|nr:hypothetical protein C8R46DRAFT_284705 [Mycena filopes]
MDPAPNVRSQGVFPIQTLPTPVMECQLHPGMSLLEGLAAVRASVTSISVASIWCVLSARAPTRPLRLHHHPRANRPIRVQCVPPLVPLYAWSGHAAPDNGPIGCPPQRVALTNVGAFSAVKLYYTVHSPMRKPLLVSDCVPSVVGAQRADQETRQRAALTDTAAYRPGRLYLRPDPLMQFLRVYLLSIYLRLGPPFRHHGPCHYEFIVPTYTNGTLLPTIPRRIGYTPLDILPREVLLASVHTYIPTSLQDDRAEEALGVGDLYRDIDSVSRPNKEPRRGSALLLSTRSVSAQLFSAAVLNEPTTQYILLPWSRPAILRAKVNEQRRV